MTLISIPNRPAGSATRSIANILGDFDAITAVVNGHLDETNLAASAGYYRAKFRAVAGITVNAVNGDHLHIGPSTTVVLPDSTVADQWVTITTNASMVYAGAIIGPATGAIFGPGHEAGVATIAQGMPSTCIVLRSGGNNWEVISGQQDSGWAPLTYFNSTAIVASPEAVPAVRQRGNQYLFRGCVTPGTSGNPHWASTPFAPSRQFTFKAGYVHDASPIGVALATCLWATDTTLTVVPASQAGGSAELILDDVVLNQ